MDISSIDPDLIRYDFTRINNESNDSGVNIKFVKFDSLNEGGNEESMQYYAFSAVDHNYVCEESKDGSDCESDMLTGYIWNQSVDRTENTTNSHSSISAIIASYTLAPSQTLEVGSSALKVVNGDGSYATGLSNISLGTDTNKCIYSFQNNEENSDNFNIQFESCPLAITGYTKSNQKQTFNGAINDVSITFNTTDFDNEENLKDDPRFTVERPLYNNSGSHIGYFRLNIVNGGFSVVDLNKNPFTN